MQIVAFSQQAERTLTTGLQTFKRYFDLYSVWLLYTVWTVEIERMEAYIGYGAIAVLSSVFITYILMRNFIIFPKIREKAIKLFIQCFTLCSFN